MKVEKEILPRHLCSGNESRHAASLEKVGGLPAPAAYGVSVSCPDGIICAGGMNDHGALTGVYKIRWDEKKGKVFLETLPDLPYALDNMYGTLAGSQLFITGGIEVKKNK